MGLRIHYSHCPHWQNRGSELCSCRSWQRVWLVHRRNQENEPHRDNDLCLLSSAGPSFGLSVTRNRQDGVLAAFPEDCRPTAACECILDTVSGWCICSTRCFKGIVMRAGNVAHLAECLPSTHGALDPVSSATQNRCGAACLWSQLCGDGGRRWKIQGDLWLHSELEASLALCEALFSRKTKYIDKSAYVLLRLRPSKGIERVIWWINTCINLSGRKKLKWVRD